MLTCWHQEEKEAEESLKLVERRRMEETKIRCKGKRNRWFPRGIYDASGPCEKKRKQGMVATRRRERLGQTRTSLHSGQGMEGLKIGKIDFRKASINSLRGLIQYFHKSPFSSLAMGSVVGQHVGKCWHSVVLQERGAFLWGTLRGEGLIMPASSRRLKPSNVGSSSS